MLLFEICIVCVVNFCRLFSIFQVWISLGRLHLIHCQRNGRWFSLLSVTQLCHPQYLAFFPLQPMHFHRSSWQCIAGRLCSVILSYAARVLVHKDSMMRSSLFLLMECPRKESWVFLTVCISGFMFLCLQISLFLTWLSLLIFKVILEHCVWKAFILFWTTASITCFCSIEKDTENWRIEELDFQFDINIGVPDFFLTSKMLPMPLHADVWNT